MRRALSLGVLASLTCVALAADGWQPVETRGGVTIEARDVPGSAVHELRATAHSPLPPSAIGDVLWKPQEFLQFLPHLDHLEILQESADDRLVYEQFHVPLLKDRDVTLRVHREVEPSGAIELSSHAVSDAGPPENDDHVRVHASETHWHLIPAGGGTDVTYTLRADIGGMVPGWVVNTAQRKTVPMFVHAVLDRAAQKASATTEPAH